MPHAATRRPGAETAADWISGPAASIIAPRKPSLVTDDTEGDHPGHTGTGGNREPTRVRDGSVMLSVLVDLEHSFPQVWRRIEVAGDLRLDQFHDVISQAMGWDDVHLHGFRSAFRGDAGVVMPTLLTDAELDDDDLVADMREYRDSVEGAGRSVRTTGIHESQVQVGEVLADVGDVLHYDYDMACAWRHVISVEGVRIRLPGEPRAALLAGERACPPEDCGGVWTYNDIVAVLTGEAVERLQTHPDDVLDQIDWLPDDFDPEVFELEKAKERVVAVDLFDLPPPMPPLDTLTPAVGDLVGACDTKGRRALAHLLADAGLDALTLLTEHRRALQATSERPALSVVDTAAALVAGGGPGASLPAELDDATCEPMVAPFRALLDAVSGTRGGVAAGDDCPFPRRLVATAVALKLVTCSRGKLVLHPSLGGDGCQVESPRGLATVIARNLPLGEVPHEIDAGTLALLCAASGVTKHEVLGSDNRFGPHPKRVSHLCHTVMEDAGWRTRAGRVSEETVAFWADETWTVLSLLSGGGGFAPQRHPSRSDVTGFPGGRVPEAVQTLARAALRISAPAEPSPR